MVVELQLIVPFPKPLRRIELKALAVCSAQHWRIINFSLSNFDLEGAAFNDTTASEIIGMKVVTDVD